MSPLDLARQRERSHADLEDEQQLDRENYLPSAVGNAAVLGLDVAITAWIVGLEDDARPVVERCRRWLEDSVARGESFGEPPSYFAMRRHRALAVAVWLLDGENPTALFRETVRLQEQAWVDIARERALTDEELRADYLPGYVRDCDSAEEWARGAAAYERHGGRSLDGEEDISTLLELAYWVCRQHVDTSGAPPSWAATAQRLLHGVLDGWLLAGQGVSAAAWLKFGFWGCEATQTPQETLHKARELVGGR